MAGVFECQRVPSAVVVSVSGSGSEVGPSKVTAPAWAGSLDDQLSGLPGSE